MNREQYIRNAISEKGMNYKEFAAAAGIPYTTLLSILNNSLGGAGIDNVIKICDALGISVETFQEKRNEKNSPVLLTDREKLVLEAYRANTDMQKAVDRLLKIGKG